VNTHHSGFLHTLDPFWPSERRRRMSASRCSCLRLHPLKVDHQLGKIIASPQPPATLKCPTFPECPVASGASSSLCACSLLRRQRPRVWDTAIPGSELNPADPERHIYRPQGVRSVNLRRCDRLRRSIPETTPRQSMATASRVGCPHPSVYNEELIAPLKFKWSEEFLSQSVREKTAAIL
jgi:hypothetical protein